MTSNLGECHLDIEVLPQMARPSPSRQRFRIPSMGGIYFTFHRVGFITTVLNIDNNTGYAVFTILFPFKVITLNYDRL